MPIKIIVIRVKFTWHLEKLHVCIFLMVITVLSFTMNPLFAFEMDVKCVVYDHSDDVNGNDVDVRVLVLHLNERHAYTVEVAPDHNAPVTVTAKTDQDGILWAIAKIPNGDKSLMFYATVYDGNNTNGSIIVSGDDDAPCHRIPKT